MIFARFIAFFAFAVISLTGCATSHEMELVPGENNRILQNLASEYYKIGQAYADVKKYDKAIEYYKLARRDAAFRKGADYQLARMYALSSKWEDAEKAFRDLLQLDPDNTDLSASLAYVRAQSGKLDEAEAEYKALVEKNPHNEQLLENYIRTLKMNDKADEAASQFAVFTDLFPDSKALDSLKELIEGKAKEPEDSESPAKSEPPPAVESKS
jgi:tetratricopeptide (TPR) repeat protein